MEREAIDDIGWVRVVEVQRDNDAIIWSVTDQHVRTINRSEMRRVFQEHFSKLFGRVVGLNAGWTTRTSSLVDRVKGLSRLQKWGRLCRVTMWIGYRMVFPTSFILECQTC